MAIKIDLKKISTLAQIPLTDKEIKTIQPQLESILGFVEQVSNVPDQKLIKNSHIDKLSELRPDEANSERSLTAKEALKNTGTHDGSSFVVKGIFE